MEVEGLMAQSKNARVARQFSQDNPPPDVYPRYQWMSYWTPRQFRSNRAAMKKK